MISDRFGSLDELRAYCAERGLVVTQRGAAICVSGAGVELLAAELRLIRPADLKPQRERAPRAWGQD